MKDRRGFALIAALWLLVALSIVGLEFGLRAHARRLSAANAAEGTQGSVAAAAGLEQAYARLSARATSASHLSEQDPNYFLDPWAKPDTMLRDTVPLGQSRFQVDLQDLGGRLNLNLADEEQLRRLFTALRMDAGQADRLAQAIADWRDPDDFHRARGAEREEYEREGALVLPANGPFERVSGLLAVRGMDEELFRRVEPYLTLRGTGRLNLNAAPRPLLLGLSGMSEEAVAILLKHRDARRPVRNLADLLLELPSGPRELLQAHQGELQSRCIFDTEEILATSSGWRDGSLVRSQSEVVFVLAAGAIFRMGRVDQ